MLFSKDINEHINLFLNVKYILLLRKSFKKNNNFKITKTHLYNRNINNITYSYINNNDIYNNILIYQSNNTKYFENINNIILLIFKPLPYIYNNITLNKDKYYFYNIYNFILNKSIQNIEIDITLLLYFFKFLSKNNYSKNIILSNLYIISYSLYFKYKYTYLKILKHYFDECIIDNIFLDNVLLHNNIFYDYYLLN